jgi:hypothetical protein
MDPPKTDADKGPVREKHALLEGAITGEIIRCFTARMTISVSDF